MYTTKDNEGHTKVCLTLTFKVKCQGQVIGFVFFEILDLDKVRIDTEIMSVLYIQPEIRKVIIVYILMTLVLKINRQGQVIHFNFFEIPDLGNVKIDTKDQLCLILLQVLLRKNKLKEV